MSLGTVSPVSPAPEPSTACFAVRAAADPGTLPRLLGAFAKRGLVPSAVHARQIGEQLAVDLQVVLPLDLAAVIAEALRQIVTVERVLVGRLASAGR